MDVPAESPPMTDPRTDRDLLFGMVALQIGLIDQGALVAAFQAWVRDRGRSLAEVLRSRGDLDGDDCAAVAALVSRQIRRHGEDTEKSLIALASEGAARAALSALGDSGLDPSLMTIVGASAPDGSDEGDRTMSYDAPSSPGP